MMPYWPAEHTTPGRRQPTVPRKAHSTSTRPRSWEPPESLTTKRCSADPGEEASSVQRASVDPADGTAPPALIVFVPWAWAPGLPSVQNNGLWSDCWISPRQGTSPNNYQVMQEARTDADWGICQVNLSFSFINPLFTGVWGRRVPPSKLYPSHLHYLFPTFHLSLTHYIPPTPNKPLN